MTEELEQGTVAGVEGEGAAPQASGAAGQLDTTPKTEPVAGKSEAEAATPTVPKEYADLIAQQVKAATEALRQEYEGKDGHISKLKSKKDKEIERLQRELEAQREADRKRAADLLESDPETAARLLLEQNEALSRYAYVQDYQAKVEHYVEESMTELGVDLDDDEAAELAATWTQRLVVAGQKGEDLSGPFNYEIGRFMLAQKDKELTATRKELDSLKGSLPSMIKEEVTKTLASIGAGPDLSQPGGGGKNPIKDIKEPTVLLTKGFAQISRAGGGRRQ